MIRDFKELIANNSVTVNCPNCKQEMQVSGKDILEEGKQIPCPNCNGAFVVKHSAEWGEDVEKINAVLKRLGNTLK